MSIGLIGFNLLLDVKKTFPFNVNIEIKTIYIYSIHFELGDNIMLEVKTIH